VSVAEYSCEVEAPPERVWEVVSDPRNLPYWDRHIQAVDLPEGGLGPGVLYGAEMAFMGVRATVPCEVLEWEPPWRSSFHLGGLLDATVLTTVAALPFDRSVLRHEVRYVFAGPLGNFAAASVNAVGGAGYALRRGTLAQRRAIERRAAERGR
jgi:uncharacterized protein YndB with AHSA1/START domain